MNRLPSKAQISRAAINRLHISMRHLFLRGGYKPLGVSGETMIDAMRELEPEIYGNINDPESVELEGLLYIFQRLPEGIESARFVHLIGREGYENSDFEPIIPSKRRRNCYRIDANQMFIEMTRGRSDIYDILTHLTFMYIEAEKIRNNALDSKGRVNRSWKMLEEYIHCMDSEECIPESVGYTYLSTLIGRTYEDTKAANQKFIVSDRVNSLFEIAYYLGKLSMDEYLNKNDREISFSSALRQNLGHHIYGEQWANNIKKTLKDNGLINKNIHIISANMHSVLNSIYAKKAIPSLPEELEDLAHHLMMNKKDMKKVKEYALKNGLIELHDVSGTNISIQIIDLSKVQIECVGQWKLDKKLKTDDVIVVMDYAFGEQAYETMDELLKPYKNDETILLNIQSINVMGKAGILIGGKGDIMIPNAHVFEGSADNYPFTNSLKKEEFEGHGLLVNEGTMITVLGTSLQNKNILRYFLKSSWSAIGLEMEGAHYQKAIQSACEIRKSISQDVKLRYAYYASDNPLETGATLASGSLGSDGIKPTYLITREILKGILSQ